MNPVTKFLLDNKTFYLATMDGDQPRVRPFGAVMEREGRLYFCTNNQKLLYRQLQVNPRLELCACSPDGKWLRLTGKAVFDTSRERKVEMLDACPELKALYNPDDGIYEVFYVEEPCAILYDFNAEPVQIAL